VIHGAQDFRVPDCNGLAYYNTLKARGVPARLLWFPDEKPLGAEAAQLQALVSRVPRLARRAPQHAQTQESIMTTSRVAWQAAIVDLDGTTIDTVGDFEVASAACSAIWACHP